MAPSPLTVQDFVEFESHSLDAILILAIAVLVSPLLGYWVLTSRLSLPWKLALLFVGVFVLVLLPFIVLLLGGFRG